MFIRPRNKSRFLPVILLGERRLYLGYNCDENTFYLLLINIQESAVGKIIRIIAVVRSGDAGSHRIKTTRTPGKQCCLTKRNRSLASSNQNQVGSAVTEKFNIFVLNCEIIISTIFRFKKIQRQMMNWNICVINSGIFCVSFSETI